MNRTSKDYLTKNIIKTLFKTTRIIYNLSKQTSILRDYNSDDNDMNRTFL